MDRIVISAAVTYLSNARDQIEKLSKGDMKKQTSTELDSVVNALDDRIQHCLSIMGPASPAKKDDLL